MLVGLPDATIRPLHRVQNPCNSTRDVAGVAGVSIREHITPVLLHQLHWLLPVEYRIKYKLGVGLLMHHIHQRQCPHYLSDSVQLAATARTSAH